MHRKHLIKISILTFLVILLGLFLFLKNQTYSLLGITADNFQDKLKTNDKTIFFEGYNHCVPDKIDIFNSDLYSNTAGHIRNGLQFERSSGDNGRFVIAIISEITNLRYSAVFNQNREVIYSQIQRIPLEPDYKLKEICDQLILKSGFILKKSDRIIGHDILIKETDESFIIVEIHQKYEGEKFPSLLQILSYSKNKYFTNVFQ